MYTLNNINQEKLYTELMNNIKKNNEDWISLHNSTEYKIGKFLLEIKRNITHFQIRQLFNSINRKIKGQKIKSVQSSNITSIKVHDYTPNYFFDKKIAIYTSVFGGYDNLLEPLFVPDNCDFFVITDIEIDKNSKWKKLDILPEMKGMNNVEKNRYVKINPHKVFKDYDYSIYIDGNIQVVSDLTEYVNRLNDIGIATHLHHQRTCVYDELIAIEKSKKDTIENIKKHKALLIKTNMPKNYGLLQCNVIVREHHNPKCIHIMEEWWNEFLNYSKRDQISLPHVLYSNNISVEEIGVLGTNIYRNSSFRIISHK